MLALTGDWLSAKLRPGSVPTADGTIENLMALVDRVEREIGGVASIRGGAGFPKQDLLRF